MNLDEDLRQTLTVVALSTELAVGSGPDTLLNLIVTTAARVLAAQAASIFLVDEAAGEMAVVVASGERAADALRLRMPLGHGIAGFVVATGQPMAVARASESPMFARDIASSIGYVPTSVVCVPMRFEDEIIGAVELFDKIDGTTFTQDDMEMLGLFADQAAITIGQSRVLRNLRTLLGSALRLSTAEDGDAAERREGHRTTLDDLVSTVEQSAEYRDVAEAAALLTAIRKRGSREHAAALDLLRSFAHYLGATDTDRPSSVLRPPSGT
ncbi:MAG: GAF domain-containing protein [Chloroflexi bacterium]|nr:GAF domain-containing protein [Chloroflexota bacterium]